MTEKDPIPMKAKLTNKVWERKRKIKVPPKVKSSRNEEIHQVFGGRMTAEVLRKKGPSKQVQLR